MQLDKALLLPPILACKHEGRTVLWKLTFRIAYNLGCKGSYLIHQFLKARSALVRLLIAKLSFDYLQSWRFHSFSRPLFLPLTTAMVTDTFITFSKNSPCYDSCALPIIPSPCTLQCSPLNISVTSSWLDSPTSFLCWRAQSWALVLEQKRKRHNDWRAICTAMRSIHLFKLTVKWGGGKYVYKE